MNRLILAWMVGALASGIFLTVEAAVPRSRTTVRQFIRAHPCPATGSNDPGLSCPGYVVDHKYPLCAGGDDSPSNMQWQTREESVVKDRVELALCRMIKLLDTCREVEGRRLLREWRDGTLQFSVPPPPSDT